RFVQPLAEYIADRPPRQTRARHTLYILPVGPTNEVFWQHLRSIRVFLETYLTLPVELLPAVELGNAPSRLRPNSKEEVRQYETGFLLDNVVVPRRPDDAFSVLGLTLEDLYAENDKRWTGLLGTWWSNPPAAIYTMWPFPDRVRSSDNRYTACLARSLCIAARGAVRTLGITPCRRYCCVSNQVAPGERTIHLCPECLKKLRWNVGFDLVDRYEALRRLYVRLGMKDEAAWVVKRIQECRQAPPAPAKEASPAPAPEEKEKNETPDTP
ncbi:MAG: hypothetical protein WBC59_00800, partial [Phycisphaerae bacterium]